MKMPCQRGEPIGQAFCEQCARRREAPGAFFWHVTKISQLGSQAITRAGSLQGGVKPSQSREWPASQLNVRPHSEGCKASSDQTTSDGTRCSLGNARHSFRQTRLDSMTSLANAIAGVVTGTATSPSRKGAQSTSSGSTQQSRSPLQSHTLSAAQPDDDEDGDDEDGDLDGDEDEEEGEGVQQAYGLAGNDMLHEHTVKSGYLWKKGEKRKVGPD